ncbi:hypothetical protein GCM10010417_21320 [Streptomyces carpaticus]
MRGALRSRVPSGGYRRDTDAARARRRTTRTPPGRRQPAPYRAAIRLAVSESGPGWGTNSASR